MRSITVLVPLLAAILTALFWLPLWVSGGLIGGDTYIYYLPQKMWYAERMQLGELPLWNSLAGHGYPLVAESQTGAFYPLNLVLYRFCDVNDAYNVSHLLHYIGTFSVASLLARRLKLSVLASLIVALIFTFGWFPPRVCLEWAIIGGFWFVWGLWCVESYLQEGHRRYLMLFSLGLGMHLLAGHFNLAFLTLLTLTAYVPARLWYVRDWLAESVRQSGRRCCLELSVSVVLGFALAAVQIWPTWELRQISQRASEGPAFDLGYGHLPPLFLLQVWLPWLWYAPNADPEKLSQALKTFSISSGTNRIETHLYFGLVPWLMLLASRFVRRESANEPRTRIWRMWLALSLLAIVYATGWLLPLTRHLPGFSFFSAPARYSMIATLGIALIFGRSFDRLSQLATKRFWTVALFVTVFGLTAFDFWAISGWVTNAFPIWQPPIYQRQNSEIIRLLKQSPQPPRMFAPGPNLPTLTGYSATPLYLGMGPAEYYDSRYMMPEMDSTTELSDPNLIAEQVAWLRRAGVTHILRFEPIQNSHWPVKLLWRGVDRFLHPAWARPPKEPLYLYELLGSRGRAVFADAQSGDTVHVTDYRANQVTLQAASPRGGEVILTDLLYPGWEVTVDGQVADARRVDGMYRGVNVAAGEHTIVWQFFPKSLWHGLLVSVIAAGTWLSVLVHSELKHGRRSGPQELDV